VSKRNVELIRSTFPAEADLAEVMRSDDPAALVSDPSAFAPDMDVAFVAALAGAPGFEGHGIAALIEGWQDWLIPWESYVLTAEDFLDAGDKVVMLARVRGRTSRDGVEVEHSPAAVWSVTGDKVTAVTFFLQRDEALEFAGLKQP
jgi:ketosteroid isomerase-like protein